VARNTHRHYHELSPTHFAKADYFVRLISSAQQKPTDRPYGECVPLFPVFVITWKHTVRVSAQRCSYKRDASTTLSNTTWFWAHSRRLCGLRWNTQILIYKVPETLNQSRRRLGCGLWWVQGITHIRRSPGSHARMGSFEGVKCRPRTCPDMPGGRYTQINSAGGSTDTVRMAIEVY